MFPRPASRLLWRRVWSWKGLQISHECSLPCLGILCQVCCETEAHVRKSFYEMKLNTCGKIQCGRAVWYVRRHPPTFPRDEAPGLIRCWPELTMWDYSIKLLPGIYPQLVLLPAIYSLLMLSKTDFCFGWMFSATAIKVFFFLKWSPLRKRSPSSSVWEEFALHPCPCHPLAS